MLGDKGYVGADTDYPKFYIPNDIVQDQELKKKRTIVERYFPLREQDFDDFFDICCGFLNLELSIHKLDANDSVNNSNITKNLINNEKVKRMNNRKRNQAYNERKRKEIAGEDD